MYITSASLIRTKSTERGENVRIQSGRNGRRGENRANTIRTEWTERGENVRIQSGLNRRREVKMSEYNPDGMDGERGKCPNTIRTEWTERGEERERQREHYG